MEKEIDIKKELRGIREVSVLRGKVEALQDIRKRFAPVFLLNGATIGEDGFNLILDAYHEILTKELETIEGHGK